MRQHCIWVFQKAICTSLQANDPSHFTDLGTSSSFSSAVTLMLGLKLKRWKTRYYLKTQKLMIMAGKDERKKLVAEFLKNAQSEAEKVWDLIDKEIEMPAAILEYKGNPLLFKNSVVLIQGKTGTHKSRLAASLVSLLVSNIPSRQLADFSRISDEKFNVIYVDTERNCNHQLPLMVLQLLKETGLTKDQLKEFFTLLPLSTTRRQLRVEVMGEQFQELIKEKDKGGKLDYVIVVDIVSDLVGDFNSVLDTNLINDILVKTLALGVTFILILHENPGQTEKARGHLGTELTNKAGTVLQIAETPSPTVYKMKILKSRMTEKYESVYLKFDPESNNLVVVDENDRDLVTEDRYLSQICKALYEKNFAQISRVDLLAFLKRRIRIGERKLEDKLKYLVENKVRFGDDFKEVVLMKTRDKEVTYSLVDADLPDAPTEDAFTDIAVTKE
jgi:hypothetical protein